MTTPGDTFPVIGDAWWIVLTASASAGSGYMLVQGTQADVYKKYGGPADVHGPYGSKDEAQKAAQAQVKSGQISTEGPPGSFKFTNPLDALGEIAHWAGVIVTAITDVHLYISLGWLFLGITLIWLGVALWLKVPQKVAGIATTVAASRV